MQICLDNSASTEASVVALGMFDGVHVGHRVLMQKAKALAEQKHVPMVVMTFSEHPLRLIRPEGGPSMLTTLDERAKLVEEQGADVFCALPFSAEIRDTPPEDFVGELVRRWHPKAVVVGFNYSFGKKGAGTPQLLAAIGQALGFETYVVPEIRLDGESVSSTRIRTALERGQANEARRLLGRPYARQAQLAQRTGEECTLVCTPNGKQELPEGRYRAILQDQEKRWPVTVKVKADRKLVCRLPESIPLRAELVFLFLREEA